MTATGASQYPNEWKTFLTLYRYRKVTDILLDESVSLLSLIRNLDNFTASG